MFHCIFQGKRICPGEELARMMLFLYAGYIIRSFYIRLSQEHECMSVRGENGITLVPKYYEIVATPMRNMKDLVKDDDVGMYKAVAVKKDIKSNTI